MSTCALPRVPLTWSFIQCRGSHSAVTQLRVILSCEPSSLRSASGSWVDVLGANSCAPITGYLPWGISTFLSYHACGSPLVMALSRVVSIPGSPSSGVDTSWVRASPSGARLAALKPPFSSPYYCSGLSRPEDSPVTPLSLGRWFSLGDASLWATPHLGDASYWRWLERSTCWLLFLGSLEGPLLCVDSDLRSTPDDRTVQTFTFYTLQLLNVFLILWAYFLDLDTMLKLFYYFFIFF